MNTAPPSRNRWIVAVLLGAAAFFLAVFTAGDYGVTWDEPPYFHASDLHVQWIGNFFLDAVHGEPGKSLDDNRIQEAWHWDPYHVPHPPFSRIVSGIAETVVAPHMDKFAAYRLGPALFFALLLTVLYLWMAELYGWPIGLFAAACLGLIPNVFGFAHIAVTDMPLAAMWLLTAYCFWKGLESWKWSLALGAVWGLALATKFPALLIPIPLLVWAHLFKRQSYANNIIAMLFVGPVVMIAVQPYLWHMPFLRIIEFLFEGVSRGYRAETNYPVFFFGRPYFSNQLPKYYTFFLTAITTPAPILGLGLLGIVSLARDSARRSVLLLFLINALFILAMGALPGAVLHDGMRQMLSVYPFIAALAGAGFYWLAEASGRAVRRVQSLQRINHLQTKLNSILLALLLLPPVFDVIVYHPFELSYYNAFIGGLGGAYDRGLETTYFLEAITPRFLEHLNQKLPPGAAINGLFANFMLKYYQREGRLRPDLKITDDKRPDYLLVVNRRSALASLARSQYPAFDFNDQPYASVSLGGVPLVAVYSAKPAK